MRPRGLPSRWVRVLPWYYTERKQPSRAAEKAAAIKRERGGAHHPGQSDGDDMNARDGFAMWLTGLMADTCLDGNINEAMEALDEAFDAFEMEIRKSIAANIRAAAPKYLDNDVDTHVWHVLDDLSNKVEHPDKDNA